MIFKQTFFYFTKTNKLLKRNGLWVLKMIGKFGGNHSTLISKVSVNKAHKVLTVGELNEKILESIRKRSQIAYT